MKTIPERHPEPENVPALLQGGDSINDGRIVAFSQPNSIAVEQFRILYTKIVPHSVHHPCYTLAITSAVKEEGKTFTAINLAMVMAYDFDQSVLLIEGDLKRPSFHTYTEKMQGLGLADVLENRIDPESCWRSYCQDRLKVLPAGKTTDRSSRLLSSAAMVSFIQDMRKRFRFVILDMPPILPMADMNISLQWVDGILLVVRGGKTPRSMVKKALQSLSTEKMIGAVMNGVQSTHSRYYYY
jgi:capsular exopolysaccharide synthesis family protein